ncbi:hypothetical protein P691DRAFT_765322 [Macrolepiota fuliginosa MF-IS2]|uniref:Uncharacterized protein n=1 Tax=Macrolepiota fuliginosa MF-IS2 TaxID=1400762 RepID=A0A9P6BYB1_9AGAR|nr:hypothetical protein P691DRAFT_765322 [Macrolepiota fuliginosa MF-IS2]
MAHKTKTKPATNALPAFILSAATEQFLVAMDQNHRIASQYTARKIVLHANDDWAKVTDDLLTMNFMRVGNTDNLNNTVMPQPVEPEAIDSQDDSNIHNVINSFRMIRQLANLFNLIPEPHQCPPPPPPCSCLHCNDKDIPMEPPAPTHAFSEAASQTPAPSHEATTPLPPPSAAATSPAAAASIPPASPQGCASYAGAVARSLNPAAPHFVRGPPHAPVALPPAQAQQPVLSKRSKQPFFAMHGPTCHQFYIEALNIPTNTSLPPLVTTANKALACAKSTLKVDSACFSPHGIMCATASTPSTSDLDIIEATLSGGLLGVCVSIPASRSFIKICDIPFFKSGMMDPSLVPKWTPNFNTQLSPSTTYEAQEPPPSSAAPSSSMEERSPSRAPRRTPEPPSANGAGRANHHSITGCCCGNPKASPPVLPTPADDTFLFQ